MKTCIHVLDSLVRTTKKKKGGELTSTRAVASTFKKLQKPQLISKETKIHSFAQVHHRHLHGSASAPSRRSCSHRRRRRHCRPATEMKPRQQRGSRRDNLKKGLSCEMTTTHTSLADAIDQGHPDGGTCDRAWNKEKEHNTTTRKNIHSCCCSVGAEKCKQRKSGL